MIQISSAAYPINGLFFQDNLSMLLIYLFIE